jgi:hypothetical protein
MATLLTHIHEQPNLTSAKRSGQSIVHKARQVQVRAMGQRSHIGQESLSPISYTTKRQRQKQRQNFWTEIHTLLRQKPQVAIEPKQTRTNSRHPEYSHTTKQPNSSTHHPAPRRIQHIKIPTQPTPKHPPDPRIIHADRQHPELQTRRQHNPLHQHPIRRRTPNHDL